ncbi:MAG: class I SAM-dependent methyltransferase [Myxococcales bacterium]|nr:class I SAM-dependent methyltransferase [Myxococcales bacterium]
MADDDTTDDDDASEPKRYLALNRTSWDKVAHSTKGRTALPHYGPLCEGEEELGLLGDIRGKRVVEIGCGDGRSLAYLHERGAAELCGLDLSSEQICNARALARERGFGAELHTAPMEENPGIALGHYDLAISLYALGWSVYLEASLQHIASYLRPGGVLVFSWEHPVFSCLKSRGKELILDKSYSDEGPIESMSWNGSPIVMHARKLSTFLNTIIACGFRIEQVIESDLHESESGLRDYPRRWYSKDRAKFMPTTVIIKASKP